jgi:hypothetical protein
MFFDALREDEDVVEVYANHAFHDEVLENVVHHRLEGGGRVGESEKHHQWLVEAAISTKRCLPLVTLFHSNILVPPSYVELREEFRAAKLIHQFGDEGKRIAILDRNGVERTIVLYKTKRPILLFDEEDRRCHGRFRRLNSPRHEVLLDELVQFDLFVRSEMIDLAVRSLRVWY